MTKDDRERRECRKNRVLLMCTIFFGRATRRVCRIREGDLLFLMPRSNCQRHPIDDYALLPVLMRSYVSTITDRSKSHDHLRSVSRACCRKLLTPRWKAKRNRTLFPTLKQDKLANKA